jgi:hypothetical protein
MNDNQLFSTATKSGMVLTVPLLLTLPGCMVEVENPHPRVYVAPAPVEVTFAAQDDYVYYPSYGVYYSSNRHQYAYVDGGAWVLRPQPRGVSVNVLLASPSVRMNFHDSPALHHAAIARQYPKSWKPSGGNDGRKDDGRGGR